MIPTDTSSVNGLEQEALSTVTEAEVEQVVTGDNAETAKGELAVEARLRLIACDRYLWERLADVKLALLSLDDAQRAAASESFGRKLSACSEGPSREESSKADGYRDARVLIDHPAALDLKSLRRRVAYRPRLGRLLARRFFSAARRNRRIKKWEKIADLATEGRAKVDAASSDAPTIGATNETRVLALASFADVARRIGTLPRLLALIHAWWFMLAAVSLGLCELIAFRSHAGDHPFRAIGLVYLIVAAIGPGAVLYEALRFEHRRVWLPRWAIIRSCVLAIIAGGYFLWFVLRSAEPNLWFLILLGSFVGLATITLITVDKWGVFSGKQISGVVASVVAASSLVTFLYNDQYKPRVALPLLVTTTTLAPQTGSENVRADSNRQVLQATVTVKNEGSIPAQIVGAIYRVDGELVNPSATVPSVAPAEVISGFDLITGSAARFSAPAGARINDQSSAFVLVQTDELIPVTVFLVPNETWTTTFSVIIDPSALSTVRMTTQISAARLTKLKLADAQPCTASDVQAPDAPQAFEMIDLTNDPTLPGKYRYACVSQRIADRSFVDRVVNTADHIYTYLVMGDAVFGLPAPVPWLYVSANDLRNGYTREVDEELDRVYTVVGFGNTVEWSH